MNELSAVDLVATARRIALLPGLRPGTRVLLLAALFHDNETHTIDALMAACPLDHQGERPRRRTVGRYLHEAEEAGAITRHRTPDGLHLDYLHHAPSEGAVVPPQAERPLQADVPAQADAAVTRMAEPDVPPEADVEAAGGANPDRFAGERGSTLAGLPRRGARRAGFRIKPKVITGPVADRDRGEDPWWAV